MKFSAVGRSHLASSLETMRDERSSAKYSLQFLRPSVRGLLLKVSAGERLPPEFIRVRPSVTKSLKVISFLLKYIQLLTLSKENLELLESMIRSYAGVLINRAIQEMLFVSRDYKELALAGIL